MSIKVLAVVGFSAMTVVAGCGSSDDDQPAGQEGTPNKQGATSATTATITAAQSAIKPGGGASAGQASANQLASAAQATQNMVTPAAGTAARVMPVLTFSNLLHPLENPPGTTGTCNCTADSCTFSACTTGQVVIDGTYSFGGGTLKTSDLKYTIKTGGAGVTADVVINVQADMTVTATAINGTFRSTGTTTTGAGGQSYSSDWDSSLDFKNVTFASGGGAPTAGSLHVKAQSSVSAGGQSQAFRSEFDVTFPGG